MWEELSVLQSSSLRTQAGEYRRRRQSAVRGYFRRVRHHHLAIIVRPQYSKRCELTASRVILGHGCSVVRGPEPSLRFQQIARRTWITARTRKPAISGMRIVSQRIIVDLQRLGNEGAPRVNVQYGKEKSGTRGCEAERTVRERWRADRDDGPLPLADPRTHAMAREMCEQVLSEINRAGGVAADVRRLLIEQPGRYPSIEVMAEELGMYPRALRRKFEAEGTSYRDLLAEVRMRLAVEYLRKTEMTNEEIASRLGYSDAANFRHAFTRWTGKSPSDFRGD